MSMRTEIFNYSLAFRNDGDHRLVFYYKKKDMDIPQDFRINAFIFIKNNQKQILAEKATSSYNSFGYNDTLHSPKGKDPHREVVVEEYAVHVMFSRAHGLWRTDGRIFISIAPIYLCTDNGESRETPCETEQVIIEVKKPDRIRIPEYSLKVMENESFLHFVIAMSSCFVVTWGGTIATLRDSKKDWIMQAKTTKEKAWHTITPEIIDFSTLLATEVKEGMFNKEIFNYFAEFRLSKEVPLFLCNTGKKRTYQFQIALSSRTIQAFEKKEEKFVEANSTVTLDSSAKVVFIRGENNSIKYNENNEIEYFVDVEGNPLFDQFDHTMELVQSRRNILFVGPSGCGKTFAAKQIYNELSHYENNGFEKEAMRFRSISCSEGMTENQLGGWLLPVGDKGRFEHVSVGFLDCYEKGGLFFFDELDACDPNVLMFINKALANDEFEVPTRYKNPLVRKHKDFVCLAAANTYGNSGNDLYSARNVLDAATLDRFRVGIVEMNYSNVIEQTLVDKDVYQWGSVIRKAIKDRNIPKIMSTRVLLDLTRMKKEHGWSSVEWGRAYFADWTETDLQSAGIRG